MQQRRPFTLILCITLSFQFMSAMQPAAAPSNKAPIDEPAQPIYYFSANDGTKLIVDRSLTELCTPLDEHLSDYLTGIPGDPSAGPASFATAQNPLPLSDQIPGHAISAWMAALKILKSNPTSYQEKLDAHFSSLGDQHLIDTIGAAHYFELNQAKVAALLGCARHYGADILERTACESFYKRVSTEAHYLDKNKIEIGRPLAARLLHYAMFPASYTNFFIPNTTTVPNRTSLLNSICYSPNGQELACHNEGVIYFIDPTTLTFYKTHIPLSPFRGGIFLDYQPDGTHLAVCSNRALLFLCPKEKTVQETLQIGEYTNSVTYNPHGQQLATITDKNVILINLMSKAQTQLVQFNSIIPTQDTRATVLRYHPYYHYLFTVGQHFALSMYDTSTTQLILSEHKVNKTPINALDTHPNGSLVAIGQGGNARLWDIRSNHQEIQNLYLPQGQVKSLAFSPCGHILALALCRWQTYEIRMIDLRNNKIINIEPAKQFSSTSNIVFNNNGTQFAYARDYGNIYLNDLTGHQPATLQEMCFRQWEYRWKKLEMRNCFTYKILT